MYALRPTPSRVAARTRQSRRCDRAWPDGAFPKEREKRRGKTANRPEQTRYYPFVKYDAEKKPTSNKIQISEDGVLAFPQPLCHMADIRGQPIGRRTDEKADLLQMRHIIGECRLVGGNRAPLEDHPPRSRRGLNIAQFAKGFEAIYRRRNGRERTQYLVYQISLCPILRKAFRPRWILAGVPDGPDTRTRANRGPKLPGRRSLPRPVCAGDWESVSSNRLRLTARLKVGTSTLC